MNIIAKGKATSTDKIMDIIFDKAQYLNIRINGERFDLSQSYNKEDARNWHITVQRKIAIALTEYYNKQLGSNEQLVENQNILE